MTEDDKEQPIPFLVYDSNTKSKIYQKNNPNFI